MTKHEKLVSKYKKVLETMGLQSDDDGLLSCDDTPIIVDDKRLALPTKKVLGELVDGKIIAFHPLSENVFEGLSTVHTWLRNLTAERIGDIVTSTGYILLRLASDKSIHDGLTEKQIELIAPLSGADEKLLANYKKLVEVIDYTTNRKFINFKLIHGGEVGGKSFSRTGNVYFPLYEEIQRVVDSGEEPVVWGIKFRKKDLDLLKQTFKIILPQIEKAEAYSTGSSSTVAPYFITILKVYVNLLADIGSTTWKFRSYIEDILKRNLHVPAKEILEIIEDDEDSLVSLSTAIKPLPGNMGSGETNDKPRASERVSDNYRRSSHTEELPTREYSRRPEREERRSNVVREIEDSINDIISPRGRLERDSGKMRQYVPSKERRRDEYDDDYYDRRSRRDDRRYERDRRDDRRHERASYRDLMLR